MYRYILLFILFPLGQQVMAKTEVFKCLDKYGRPTYSTQATCDKPEMVTLRQKKKKNKKNIKNELLIKNRKKQCKESKTTLRSYQKAPFLTKMINKDGKDIKIRLSPQEKKEAMSGAIDEVDYWCKN